MSDNAQQRVFLWLLGAATLFLVGAIAVAMWDARKRIDPDDTAQVAYGGEIYSTPCAACHGANLQGQPDCRQPCANGRMPAPPHDTSGHTLHHTDAVPFGITKYGLMPDSYRSDSDMRAFQAGASKNRPGHCRDATDRTRRQETLMQAVRHLAATIALVAALSPAVAAPDEVTLTHVHGLAYSADGERLMIPSHHGLAVFSDGKWSKAPGPEHDYMGFVATAEALYSSGHPARGSGLTNPCGVIRSDDGDRKWASLGLSGETDFHLLAAGWRTNAIYAYNPAPNSRMKSAGLYSSLNDGFSWRQHALDGVAGRNWRAIARDGRGIDQER
ncbi:MAG: hypothetical protein H2060_08690 [Azoarcus sp.]|nr:hypothetical protein [Azoarcus sp.]